MRRTDARLLGAAALGVAIVLAALTLAWRGAETSQVADSDLQTRTQVQQVARQPAPVPGSGSESAQEPTEEGLAVWTLLDPATATSLPKVRDDVPATLLQLDRAALESLGAGDRLALPLSPSVTALIRIDTVKVNDAFNVTSLRGGSLVNGAALPVVITYGANSTLATVSTADGVFELRGTAEQGWLYRSADLGLPGGDAVDYLAKTRDTQSSPP